MAAGLPDTVFELLPLGRNARRQVVEDARTFQAGDGGLDFFAAAERIEVGGVALVSEKLAPGLYRAVRLAPPAHMHPAEIDDGPVGFELSLRPLQQPVAPFQAGVEPIREPGCLPRRAGGVLRFFPARRCGAVLRVRGLGLLALLFEDGAQLLGGPRKDVVDARPFGGPALLFGGDAGLLVPGDLLPDLLLPFLDPDRRGVEAAGPLIQRLPFRGHGRRGTRPSQAEKSRPRRKLSIGGAKAWSAIALIGPIPGMVMSRAACSS